MAQICALYKNDEARQSGAGRTSSLQLQLCGRGHEVGIQSGQASRARRSRSRRPPRRVLRGAVALRELATDHVDDAGEAGAN